MGLFSWWRGSRRGSPEQAPNQQPAKGAGGAQAQVAVPGTRWGVGGAAAGQPDATVFEFGSAAESGTAVTLAGYCPVSDELEPCRWELVPATGEGAPQFRIVF
uniref:Allyl alcohol dehydrogenase-like protein n=1 Tax=Aegilops tauschii TaxID=37682 RepID=M8CMF4_AEGTA